MHPPPSGRHAMRCLYVIGRDSWVWDMSNTQWLEMDSSHGVGECSVTAVCPRAGVYSRRRLCENYCCCCCKSHCAVGIAHKECNNKSAICRARWDIRPRNRLQSWLPKCPWSPEASKWPNLFTKLITKGTLFGASNFWRYVADISIIIFIFIFIFPLHVHFHLRLRLWSSC